MSKESIILDHKNQHNTLSEVFYAKKRDKGVTSQEQVDFNNSHRMIYESLDAQLIEGGFKEIPVPPRDVLKEIDELKIEIKNLKLDK